MNRFRETIATTFHIMALLLTFASLVPAAALAVWALDRTPPVDNLQGRFDRWDSLDPPVALITWTADRHKVCPGQAFRWAFGDRPFNLNTETLPPPGAHDQLGAKGVVWTVTVSIPREALETSRTHINLHVRKVWECNPLHHWWPIVMDPDEILIPIPTRTR